MGPRLFCRNSMAGMRLQCQPHDAAWPHGPAVREGGRVPIYGRGRNGDQGASGGIIEELDPDTRSVAHQALHGVGRT